MSKYGNKKQDRVLRQKQILSLQIAYATRTSYVFGYDNVEIWLFINKYFKFCLYLFI